MSIATCDRTSRLTQPCRLTRPSQVASTSGLAEELEIPGSLRIAYLTSEYPKVSHTFIRREIQELERRGHEVIRLSIRPHGKLVDPGDLSEAPLTLSCLGQPRLSLVAKAAVRAVRGPRRWLRGVRAMLRMHRASDRGLIRHTAYLIEAAYLADRLKRLGIDHVHVHFGTNAAAVALIMSYLSGITYSMTVHGPGEFDAPVGLSLAEKVARASFVIAISHYCQAQLHRWVDVAHWDRIHVVRCTINPAFLDDSEPIAEKSDRFLCIGRLTAQKGQVKLLEAFAAMVRAGRPGHLVLAGDGDLRGLLQATAARLDIADRITITGWLSEEQVRAEIRRARVVVLPSSAEGLPVVLMEAMAMGRPVISTHTAAIPELVRDGVNGWLVPAGDTSALTETLRIASATSSEVLMRMGMLGKSLVTAQHHCHAEGAKLERLFRIYTSEPVAASAG